ncbi:MAG: hypothetical protein ACYDB0_00585 [Acidithiobacillus sp.]
MGLLESLNRLARHFEVKPDDAPDVAEYKFAMTGGFNGLRRGMRALDAAVAAVAKEGGPEEEDGSAPE